MVEKRVSQQQPPIQLKKSSLHLAVDPSNSRLRLDSYLGDAQEILAYLETVAKEQEVTKIICYVREADIEAFIAYGYVLEAFFKWYYQGEHAYVLSKFLSSGRYNWQFGVEENRILIDVQQQALEARRPLGEGFVARPATPEDAYALSSIYKQTFQVYPTPLTDVTYIQTCMLAEHLFYVITFEGKIVSVASAEKNERERTAELTDCATLPEFRKFGLMRNLLHLLEQEMKQLNYISIYSLARGLSYGMNKALFQEGFQYTGRLIMNCYIFDKLEDMNLWVKRIG